MKVVCARFGFATTIGIISGNCKQDRRTAAIIDAVKAQSKEPIEFIGVIGDQYAKKLTKQYASSSMGDKNEIVITRNYDEIVQDSIFNPYRSYSHYKNSQIVSKLQGQQFFEELHSKGSPAVITVGSFSIIKRVYQALNKFYEEKNAEKPLRLAFDLLNSDRRIENEKLFDFLYHYLPRSPAPVTRYTFPSMCIGYEGLFKAFRFLNKYNTEGNAWSHEQFSIQVNSLVRKARAQFRKTKGFTEDQYLILLAPGNEESQIKLCFSKFASALSGFSSHDKIKSINKDFFKVLVLAPEDKKIADLIKSKASSLGSQYNVTVVEQNDKYGAMCAADYAVLHNGEITVEAAACQLPAIVLNSMSNVRAYISYLYNGHESPLNISTNYHAYEEMFGSLSIVPLKITTSMVDHFERPKLRFNYVKLYRDEIHRMLMLNGRNKELDLSKTGVEAAAADILKKIELRKKLTNEKPLNFYERKQKLQLA